MSLSPMARPSSWNGLLLVLLVVGLCTKLHSDWRASALVSPNVVVVKRRNRHPHSLHEAGTRRHSSDSVLSARLSMALGRIPSSRYRVSRSGILLLLSSKPNDEDDSGPLPDRYADKDILGKHDYSQEETLMCVHVTAPDPALSTNDDDDLNELEQTVQKFCQSFPFSAILPVQPLTYIPITSASYQQDDDNPHTSGQTGVEIRFLRKKQPDKPSTDGGIGFFIRQRALPVPPEDEDDDDDEIYVEEEVPLLTTPVIEIMAKRMSYGQTIEKTFAEKLIVTKFVEALIQKSSKSEEQEQESLFQVRSLYHKWM